MRDRQAGRGGGIQGIGSSSSAGGLVAGLIGDRWYRALTLIVARQMWANAYDDFPVEGAMIWATPSGADGNPLPPGAHPPSDGQFLFQPTKDPRIAGNCPEHSSSS